MSAVSSVLAPNIAETELRLRRWTRGEFDRMLDLDIFPANEAVELSDGRVYPHGDATPRPWTQSEYHRLSDTGILGWDERVELLEGNIVEKMTNNPPHVTSVGKTVDALRQVFRDGYLVREQGPLGASLSSEPEPDAMVVPGVRDDYADHHPTPGEAAFVVEVSDSSLSADQGCKMRTLEVRRQPENGQYTSLDVYHAGETVSPLAAPDQFVSVADLLPLARTNHGS